MKGDMPGTCTRRQLPIRRFDMSQRSRVRVDSTDKNAIGAKVGGQREPAARIGKDAVRVGTFLPLGVWPFALMLIAAARRAEPSIAADGEACDVTPHIVRHVNRTPAPVDAHVTRRSAMCQLLAKAGQGAIATNLECADRTSRSGADLVDFIHRIEHAAVRM